jgi:hypothetical protein
MRNVALLLFVALLSACGSQKTTVVTNRLVTPEQERVDLTRAHELGIISDAEYKQELSKLPGQR